MNKVMTSLLAATAALSAIAATVEPKATDEILSNPGMGFVHFYYSSRIWAYGAQQEPGVYTLAVSVGRKDGKPEIALPLSNGVGRIYPLGKIAVAE